MAYSPLFDDIYTPVKECIQLLKEGKEEPWITAYFRDKGMTELQVKGIVRQAEEVWYTLQLARKKMVEGLGIAALSIGGSIYSLYARGSVFLILYGTAGLGLGWFFWGVYMKRKTRNYS